MWALYIYIKYLAGPDEVLRERCPHALTGLSAGGDRKGLERPWERKRAALCLYRSTNHPISHDLAATSHTIAALANLQASAALFQGRMELHELQIGHLIHLR